MNRDLLRAMFDAAGSDKSRSHHYEDAYAKVLPSTAQKVLEIGVTNTTADRSSLWAWSEIYPDAKIFGVDNDPQKMITSDRISTFLLNQSDRSIMHIMGEAAGPFDVIVDDGSHIFDDASASFLALWTSLVPGGVYCIEDVAKGQAVVYGQQTVRQWRDFLDKNLTDDFEYGVIDTNPGENDDSIVIWIRRIV